jgi:O-antigen ligase
VGTSGVVGAAAHMGRRSQRAAAGTFMRMKFDPLRISLFLLMIITVSRIHQHFKVIGKLRPALLLAFATAAYAFMQPKLIRPENLKEQWIPRVVIGLAIMACLSVPFGVSLGGSAVFIIEEYSKTIIFAILLMVSMRTATDLFTLVWAYVISCGILVWMSLFVFGLSKAAGSEAHRLSNLYTFDANDVGLIVLIGLALTLWTFQTSGKKGKIASGVILLGIGATLARTGSRGAFVGLVAVGIVLLFALTAIPVMKRVTFAVVTVLGLMIAAPEGYWDQMRTLLQPKSDYNWQTREGRKKVAKRGIGYMMDYPLFGVGINNFWRMECILGDKAKNNRPNTALRCTPPHNSYIQSGAELGIPGLILYCSLVFGGIGGMWRLRRRMPRHWGKPNAESEERFLYLGSLYVMLSMIGYAVTSTFLTFAWLDPVYIVGSFMVGLYVATQERLRRAPGGPIVAPAPRRPQARGRPPVPGASVPSGSGFIPAPN